MEPFIVNVRYAGVVYKYRVEQTEVTPREERYKVFLESQILLLSNNWPFFRNRGLKHRKPTWKVVEDSIREHSFQDKLIEALEGYIGSLERK